MKRYWERAQVYSVLKLGLGNARAVSAYITDGRLQMTLDFFGRLWTSLGIFGNDRVVFKNPSTPRIKISRLYFMKKLAGISSVMESKSNFEVFPL